MNNLHNVEFFSFENDVYYKTGDGVNMKLEESSREIIRPIIAKIEGCYSTAYAALSKEYGRFSYNIERQQYKMVRRFIRCNFGNIDNVLDIDGAGRFNFEYISCPLRGGDCPHEERICNPRIDSGIAKKEMEVMELFFNGRSRAEIAEILGKDESTVRNQINHVYTKLGIHEKAEFIDYAHVNKLFNPNNHGTSIQ